MILKNKLTESPKFGSRGKCLVLLESEFISFLLREGGVDVIGWIFELFVIWEAVVADEGDEIDEVEIGWVGVEVTLSDCKG